MDGFKAWFDKLTPPQLALCLAGCFFAALAVICVVGFGLEAVNARPPSPAPAWVPPPVTVAKADDTIISAEVRPSGVLAVGSNLNVGWDGPFYVTAAEITVRRIGQTMQAGAVDADGARDVTVIFTVPGTDRLGREERLPFMEATFSAADLRAAQFDNMAPGQILDLATTVKTAGPTARTAVWGWCADQDHLAEAPRFCVKALKRT